VARDGLARELACLLHELLGDPRGGAERLQVTVALDGEAGHGFAGRRNACDDTLGPVRLDAHDHRRRHVGVGAGADEGAEGEIEVGTVLQAAVVVWQRERTGNSMGDGLTHRVGEIIHRKNDHIIAHADAAIWAAVSV
jgi:hypothetical protein